MGKFRPCQKQFCQKPSNPGSRKHFNHCEQALADLNKTTMTTNPEPNRKPTDPSLITYQ